MSRLGLNAQTLSRCGSGWTNSGVSITAPLCHSIRQVSTKRTIPKKAQVAKKATEAAILAKEKTKAPSATTKQPKNPSTKAAAAAAPEKPVPVVQAPTATKRGKKKTRASESSTGTATSVEETDLATSTKSSSWTKKSKFASPTQAASTAASTQRVEPRTVTDKTGSSSKASAASARDSARPKVDPSGPEYKQAARKWVSTIVALPVLIITSYFLFDRLGPGKNLSSAPRTDPAVPAAKDA